MMEQLEKYFYTAFGAPDGVKKLRQLILTFAMQGKLVPQLPKENSASQLLQLINKEKSSYWKLSNTKPLGPFIEIDSENVPYNVPAGWKWVRLGEILLSITGGGTPSKNNAEYWRGSIPWASVKDLNVDTYLEKTIDSISEKAIKESSTNLIPKGSIIVCTRMGLGKIAINIIDVTINQDLKALKLSKYIDEIFFINKFKEYKIVGKGVTVHGIRQDELLNFLFPLPPLEEQMRIVARINELYCRCDELEKLRAERDQKRLAVHTAAILKMLDAPDQETFDDAWKFITHHFGDLYTARENVAELRKAILQLAVMGKLVKQDAKEGTASELLVEIEREKRKVIKDKTFKPSKELTGIDKETLPFKIPKNWEWVKFGDISFQITDGTHYTPKYINKGVPFLSVKDMSSGKLDFSNTRFISKEEHQELTKRCHPRKGDLLLTKVGTTGIPILIDTDKEFSVFVSVAVIKFPTSKISGKYLTWLINSPVVKKQSAEGTEGIGNKNLVLRKIQNFLLPLPPLFEQSRIANKVDSLMKLCDSIEQRIVEMQEKQGEVLGAVMGKGFKSDK